LYKSDFACNQLASNYLNLLKKFDSNRALARPSRWLTSLFAFLVVLDDDDDVVCSRVVVE
jgi:hypothetical protein